MKVFLLTVQQGGWWMAGVLVLTLVLCLMPGPWLEAGEQMLLEALQDQSENAGTATSRAQQAVVTFIQDVRHDGLKQWVVHFVLMAGLAWSMARKSRMSAGSWWKSSMLVFGVVLLIATGIECLQELLPSTFSRGFAWSDIGASAAGGLVGLLGVLPRMRFRKAGVEAEI